MISKQPGSNLIRRVFTVDIKTKIPLTSLSFGS